MDDLVGAMEDIELSPDEPQPQYESTTMVDLDLEKLREENIALQAEKLHLMSLLARSKASHGKSTGHEDEDTLAETSSARSSHGHPAVPISLMSLSTGSEESAVEDEKFVKIKPCEMESSSSKASSQSGKDFELEEQVNSLNEQLAIARKSLSEKEEECKEVKHQLETILLEKNVESLSISSLSSDLKAMKVNIVAKDEQMEEVNLVLDDLLAHFKTYLPASPPDDSGSGTDAGESLLETKLNLLKCLPTQFRSLEQDGEGMARALAEAQAELKELQDQQGEIIGGYQMVTRDYEKLQAEFEEYKLREVESTDNQQLKEELERFKDELLSKDEDLMEIQRRCDEFEEQVNIKARQLEKVEREAKKYQIAAKAAVKDATTSKAAMKELQAKHNDYEEMLAQKVKELEDVQLMLKGHEENYKKMLAQEVKELEDVQLILEDQERYKTTATTAPEELKLSETKNEEKSSSVADLSRNVLKIADMVDSETDPIYIPKLDKYTETDETDCPPSSSPDASHSQFVTLQNRCIEELRKQNFEKQSQRLDAAEDRNSDLVSKIAMLENELVEKDKTLEDFRIEITSHAYDLRDKEQELQHLRARLPQETKLQEMEEEIASLRDTLRVYETDLQEHQKHTEYLSSKLSFKQTEVEKHAEIVEELRTKISLQETELQRKETELDALHRRREADEIAFRQESNALEDLNTRLSLQEIQSQNALEQATSKLSSLENLLSQKEEELQDLRAELHEIQTCVETKTTEINETVHAKNLEIQQLMAAYQSYVDTKEKMEFDLTGVINSKSECISRLESELDTMAHEREVTRQEQEELNALAKEQIESIQNYLAINSAEIEKLTQEKESYRVKLKASEDQIQQLLNKLSVQEESIATAVQELSRVNHLRNQEVSDLGTQLTNMKIQTETYKQEAVHLRSEKVRLMNLWKNTKDTAREEYQNKLKEEEILRESECLMLQQQLTSKCEELLYVQNSLKTTSDQTNQLLEQNSLLSSKLETVTDELQSKIVELEREVKAKKQLELEATWLKSEVEAFKKLTAELEAKAIQVEEALRHAELVKIETLSAQEGQQQASKLKEEIEALKDEIAKKERKMELLQSKITEIENSEMKAYEESFVLKNWIKRLEMENQRYQEEITMLVNSATKDPGVHPKVMKIQEELLRLIYALDERDKRCVQLTVEITRLLEERDELQLKLSSVLKHNMELSMALGGTPLKSPIYDKKDLEQKLAQLEDSNFRINIDLKREREARKLVQEELLYSQTARMYRERELKSRLADSSASSHSQLSPSSSSDSSPQSPEPVGNPSISTKRENVSMVHI